MANRFTNTSKWQDDWFLSLSNDYRIIWQYLNDHCSIVGVWKKGVKHLNYFCNTSITEDELKKNFAGKIIDCGEYFFIPSFLKDQYPGKLNEKSGKPIIQGVFKEIRALNLISIIKESLGDDFLTIKQSLDNDCTIIKEKERVNGKRKQEKETGGVGEKLKVDELPPSQAQIEEIFVKHGLTAKEGEEFYRWRNGTQGWDTLRDWRDYTAAVIGKKLNEKKYQNGKPNHTGLKRDARREPTGESFGQL